MHDVRVDVVLALGRCAVLYGRLELTRCCCATHIPVQVNTPMTLTEKIIAKACDRPSVAPNDNVWVKTDVLMTHDVCGPGTIGNFYKEFGPEAKVRVELDNLLMDLGLKFDRTRARCRKTSF